MTETVKTDKATVYEVGFHIVPAVSPETLPKEVDAIKAVLTGAGATIISEEFPKLRTLAYTLVKAIGPVRNKYDTAHFGWIKFEAPAESQVEIKKALDANEKIIRFLIVKTVKENTLYGATILPQIKEEGAKTDEVSAPKEAPAPSQEELDKTIDKLVI